MTESSRECYNRPPLGVERQRLDVNQNPSTTHRLAIVGYSLDSISGHFIIQLGQLSHRTPQKRGLQSNWKLHTGPGGDAKRGLAVVTPLSFFQLVVHQDFEQKIEGETEREMEWGGGGWRDVRREVERGGSPSEYRYMFGTTCVFMKLMECIWVGEGFNLVSGCGGKKNRGEQGNPKLWEESGTEEYTWGNNEEKYARGKRGDGEMHCEGTKRGSSATDQNTVIRVRGGGVE